MTQLDKAERFKALHQRPSAFIIPNPYDPGTARLLERLGFQALATTSAGFAFTVGQRDRTIGRERMMAHAADIASATDLPVSGDLENGYGDRPEDAAETIRQAGNAGLVGASIEDLNPDTGDLYDLGLATDRIQAAVEAARSLPFPFTLTARAENFVAGQPDTADTIRRLQAYEASGADVLYAPGLPTKEDLSSILGSIGKPLNVLLGLRGVRIGLSELSTMGVKRVSVGSALSRTALAAFLRGAEEMVESGTFQFAEEAADFGEISRYFD